MWIPRNRFPRDRRFALVALAALLAFLQGCAPVNVAISPEDRSSLRTAPVIYVVQYEDPTMQLMTPTGVAGTGLITSMTGSGQLPRGSELQRAYGLPDAVSVLTRDFVQKLTTEGRLSNLRVVPERLPLPIDEEVARYRGKYAGGLVLEIYGQMGAGYKAVRWQTYNFGMFGRARLIRAADGKVLWKEICNVGGHNDDALTLDVTEFEANNAARLKQLIPMSADRCSRVLTDKLLGAKS